MGLRDAIAAAAILAPFAGCFAGGPAFADGPSDWTVAPLTTPLDDWTASLGVNLSGAAYAAHQPAGKGRDGVQAFAVFAPSLSRSFPNGWEIGAKASLLGYHDHLSGDNYGNDIFELAYLYAQTPYGRVEIGQANGAAYSQSVGAPVVDSPAAINDANVTFFKDPATGLAFNGIFNLRTGVFLSANDAKISYIAPRIGGLQLSASYTPDQTKGVLPFASKGHHVSDRVSDIVEGNANYTGQFGNWSMQTSASFGVARDAAPTFDHGDVWDWGAGVEADYAMDDAKLSLGAAYRVSNAYTFNVRQAFQSGVTHNCDIATVYTNGPWIAGIEYETGMADGAPGLPALRESGWNPSVAYAMNANLQLTLGWQDLHFRESVGNFYNGKPSIAMDALYLHAAVQI